LSKTPAGKPRDAELSDLSQDCHPKKIIECQDASHLFVTAPREGNHWRFVFLPKWPHGPFRPRPLMQEAEDHSLLVLLQSVYVSVSKNSFLCALQGASLFSGCKGTNFLQTHQIFLQLFLLSMHLKFILLM